MNQEEPIEDSWEESDEAPELIKKEMLNVTVEAGQEPLRIDKYVMVRIEHATRSKIQQGIETGLVTVNGLPTKNNYKVRPHDHVVAWAFREENSDIVQAQDIPLNIVFEDDHILLINKKPGIVVHPGVGNKNGTLINGVAFHLQKVMTDVSDLPRVGLVHRIDKDTSGLLLFGKTPHAMSDLARQFKERTTSRTYHALVWGDVQKDGGTIDAHLARHERNRKQFDVYPDGSVGKHAITHYKVLERFGYVTLVECKLETGRTHQIRVHMKYIGHTLFNDERYGGDRALKGTIYQKYKSFVANCFNICPRQALHAKTLGFVHPYTGEEMFFESETPADMTDVLAKWRKYVAGNRTNNLEEEA
jgi:23S rRNA pseudouridine1911/1915/1917 synthase